MSKMKKVDIILASSSELKRIAEGLVGKIDFPYHWWNKHDIYNNLKFVQIELRKGSSGPSLENRCRIFKLED